MTSIASTQTSGRFRILAILLAVITVCGVATAQLLHGDSESVASARTPHALELGALNYEDDSLLSRLPKPVGYRRASTRSIDNGEFDARFWVMSIPKAKRSEDSRCILHMPREAVGAAADCFPQQLIDLGRAFSYEMDGTGVELVGYARQHARSIRIEDSKGLIRTVKPVDGVYAAKLAGEPLQIIYAGGDEPPVTFWPQKT